MTTTTQSITTAHSVTANNRFKAKYPRYLLGAVIWAVVIHALAFVVSPQFSFKPYQLKEQAFEVIQLPANIEIPPPPKEVALPQVPVEAASGEEVAEDEAIAPTTFDNIEDLPPPPPPPPLSARGTEVFLAFDEPPVLIHSEAPEYPALARAAGLEGTVAVKVLVDEHGNVIEAEVLLSDMSPVIERAALDAAMKCKFRPAKQGGIPVKAHVMIPFQFKLTGR